MTDRFKVVHVDDLDASQREEAFIPDHACAWCVVDEKTKRVLGSDYAEPEDKILLRDLRWVPEELNRMNTVMNLALDAIAHMNEACIRRDSDRTLWIFVDDIEKILKGEK